jgi:hypothetical protein
MRKMRKMRKTPARHVAEFVGREYGPPDCHRLEPYSAGTIDGSKQLAYS